MAVVDKIRALIRAMVKPREALVGGDERFVMVQSAAQAADVLFDQLPGKQDKSGFQAAV